MTRPYTCSAARDRARAAGIAQRALPAPRGRPRCGSRSGAVAQLPAPQRGRRVRRGRHVAASALRAPLYSSWTSVRVLLTQVRVAADPTKAAAVVPLGPL